MWLVVDRVDPDQPLQEFGVHVGSSIGDLSGIQTGLPHPGQATRERAERLLRCSHDAEVRRTTPQQGHRPQFIDRGLHRFWFFGQARDRLGSGPLVQAREDLEHPQSGRVQ